MKMKTVFLTLFCLLFSVITGQSNDVQSQESPQVQQDSERLMNNLRSAWNRGGVIMASEVLLQDTAFRVSLGISNEYYREIQTSVSNAAGSLSDDPEYKKLNQESDELFRTLWGKEPGMNSAITARELERMRNADPEVLKRAEEVGQKLQLKQLEFLAGASQRNAIAWENAITPELKQKILEAQLAAMGETSTMSPHLFEALNLTDAQRQQMDRIKMELEPEFEKHREIYGSNAAKILERVNAARERHQRHASEFSFGKRGDAPEEWRTVYKNLREESEHKKLLDESYASSKALATLFRTRMREILTDKQRERLQELIDNPPPHARLLIQRLKRENWGRYEEAASTDPSGRSERAESDKDVWVPGPDSWKPGDPIPEGARQPRDGEGRFPRPEN